MRAHIVSGFAMAVVLAAAQFMGFGAMPALGQGTSPSADQIIRSLTPTGVISNGMSRGIRPALPLEPRSSQVQSAFTSAKVNESTGPVSGKQTEGRPADAAPAIDLTINFATGSTDLTPQAIQVLNALGMALSSSTLSDYRFRVEGHTDTVGSRDFNRTLSQQRAEAVARYIGTKFGVATTRMEPVGLGSDAPLVVTPDQVAEPRNRRVKIVNLGS